MPGAITPVAEHNLVTDTTVGVLAKSADDLIRSCVPSLCLLPRLARAFEGRSRLG